MKTCGNCLEECDPAACIVVLEEDDNCDALQFACSTCWRIMLRGLRDTEGCNGDRTVEFDVNAAVAHAMNGPQVVLADECCQRSTKFPEYAASDHPKILPPEDITLTPEQLELLSPHTVVAGRLE